MGRVLVVGLDGGRSRAVADALRSDGHAVLEASSAEDAEGVGFSAVVGRGCEAWYALLRAAARPGLRVAFADDPATARHADRVVPADADPQRVAATVGAHAARVASGRWAVGSRVVDLDRLRVDDDDLGPQEVALLATLLAADGETVTTDRLLREAWGLSGGAATRAVDHAAHRLRQALEPDPAEPSFLRTVRGEGLRLVGARRLLAAAPEPDRWPADPTAEGLDRLAARLDPAVAGSPRVAVVGPAGVGKSVLVRAWARARGWTPEDDVVHDGGRTVVTAWVAPPGFVAVALPDRTPDLGAIAAHAARSLGVEPPSAEVLAAVVARIGPNALGVVRFVERAVWLPPSTLLERLDRGELGVLASASARDPRHRSLVTALSPALDAFPTGATDALAALARDPRAPVAPGFALALVDAGLVVRCGDELRPWPALAAWTLGRHAAR